MEKKHGLSEIIKKHLRLAETDVATDEAVHRFAAVDHVVTDLGKCRVLVLRWLVLESRLKGEHPLAVGGARRALQVVLPRGRHCEEVCRHLEDVLGGFRLPSLVGRMETKHRPLRRRIGCGMMEGNNGESVTHVARMARVRESERDEFSWLVDTNSPATSCANASDRASRGGRGLPAPCV